MRCGVSVAHSAIVCTIYSSMVLLYYYLLVRYGQCLSDYLCHSYGGIVLDRWRKRKSFPIVIWCSCLRINSPPSFYPLFMDQLDGDYKNITVGIHLKSLKKNVQGFWNIKKKKRCISNHPWDVKIRWDCLSVKTVHVDIRGTWKSSLHLHPLVLLLEGTKITRWDICKIALMLWCIVPVILSLLSENVVKYSAAFSTGP